MSSLRAGVVARSAAHWLLAGKAWGVPPSGQPSSLASNGTQASTGAYPPWVLDRPMICEALALPAGKTICEEVEMFLEQAVIAVRGHARAHVTDTSSNPGAVSRLCVSA